jgi:hypothetical protein
MADESSRGIVPDFDTPENTEFLDGFIKNQRAESQLDGTFSGADNLGPDDVAVTGVGVEVDGVSEAGFDEFRATMQDEPGFSFDSTRKRFQPDREDDLIPPDPRQVAAQRDPEALAQDRRRKAPVTTDPAKYAKNPDEFDYPFVDTPRSFNEENTGTNTLIMGEREIDKERLRDLRDR